jgi:hypothetical protein
VVKGTPNGTRLQRGDALRLLGGAHARGTIGLIARIAKPDLEECVTAPATDRSPARGQLEGVVAQLAPAIGRDDEVGWSRPLAGLQEQDVTGDRHFP